MRKSKNNIRTVHRKILVRYQVVVYYIMIIPNDIRQEYIHLPHNHLLHLHQLGHHQTIHRKCKREQNVG